MNIENHCLYGDELVWVHFNTTPGQTQCGDYAYQKAYAKNRSEKIQDGETYIKMRITSMMCKYGKLTFNLITVNKDGTEDYDTQCDDMTRMTLIRD